MPRTITFPILAFFLTMASSASAKSPLAGVEAVVLVVREPNPQTKSIGFTREKLETEMTMRLRRAGFGVVDTSPEKLMAMSRHQIPAPMLIVKVNAIKKRGGYVGGVKIWVAERAELLREPGKYVHVNTYHYSAGWADASPSSMRAGLRLQLRRAFKDFIQVVKPTASHSRPRSSGTMFSSMPSDSTPNYH